MRAAQKVMPPISLSWPMTSELDGGGMAVEVKLPTGILLPIVAV